MKKIKNGARAIPWKFLVFQILLPSTDLITDGWSGLNYYREGHPLWAYCIWGLMWGPLVLSITSETLNLKRRCQGKKKKSHESPQVGTNLEMKAISSDVERNTSQEPDPTWFQKHEMRIWNFAAQIPFFQPIVHTIFAYKLYRAEDGMEKAEADYIKVKDWDVMDRREEMKDGVVEAGKKYVRWKKEKSRDQIQ